jgi:regulator of sigma E protease
METFIKASQFLLSLSFLVILHELGHFIPAKFFKTKVEKFYLFFDPWFSLFKWKKNGTEYGIGWLPLGGYVKIAGMVDESMDTKQLNKPAEPWEFRAKPAWQRLIIMLGGVFVNFMLAFAIYIGVIYVWGETTLSESKDGYMYSELAQEKIGFENGDVILAINGKYVDGMQKITEELLYGGDIQVKRANDTLTLHVPEDFLAHWAENKEPIVNYRMPFFVAQIPKESHNAETGLAPKDHIVGILGDSVRFVDEFVKIAEKHKGEKVEISVLRNHEKILLQVQLDSSAKLGVMRGLPDLASLEKLGYCLETKHYTLAASIPLGIKKGFATLQSYIRQFQLIFNPKTEAYKSLGGFVSMGSIFPSVFDWQTFWGITAFLSIILGFMNLLPIPALDGGHVVFLLYEIITGKAANQKVLEVAQTIGMILLFGLMFYANLNDLFKFIFK